MPFSLFLDHRSQPGRGGEGRRRRGISRGQQSIEEALENIDSQFTANEEGRGGEGRGNESLEYLMGDQVDFIVTQKKKTCSNPHPLLPPSHK